MSNSLSILSSLLPDGKLEGREYTARNPRRNDKNPGSFKFNVDTETWADFALPDVTGTGIISYASYVLNIPYKEAAERLGLSDTKKISPTHKRSAKKPGKSIKNENDKHAVTDTELTHPDLGALTICPTVTLPVKPGKLTVFSPDKQKTSTVTASAVYPYTDATGQPHSYVIRIDTGTKKLTPPIRQAISDNKTELLIYAPPLRTLYNLHNIPKYEAVLYTEGEKCATTLQQALGPDACATCSSGGTGSIKLTDYTPLAGKSVTIWPDADDPGRAAAAELISILRPIAAEIYLLDVSTLPDGITPPPQGWDCADLARGHLDFITQRRRRVHPSDLPTDTQLSIHDPFAWVNTVTFVPGKDPVYIGPYAQLIDRRSIYNASLLLRHFPGASNTLVYNIFEDDIYLVQSPPWHNSATPFIPHPVREDDYTLVRMWLETLGMKTGANDTASVVATVAKQNTINPPRDHFETLRWDGRERLKTWLTYYLGAETQPAEYLAAVGTKWLVGAVSRIYQPGAKFDTCLFLEGKQNIGKSLTLAELATFNGQRYFTDQNIDFNNKDSLLILQGKIICEMAELVSFKRAETNEIKAFITRQSDIYRPPYARSPVQRPRMFVLAGTHNPDGSGLFTDITGNRRYWPVTCGDTIDIEAVKRDREQLWAEAVHLYKHGCQTWLTDEEFNLAKRETELRMNIDALTEEVQRACDELTTNGLDNSGFTTDAVLTKLKIPAERKSNQISARVKSVLSVLGYIEIRTRAEDGQRPRLWKKPTFG